MTTIKATCPTCGEVALHPDDIELRVDRTDQDSSFYEFICPTCVLPVRKPADDRVVRLLVSGGVPALVLQSPPPRVRLDQRFAGPPISHDDLLDFHALLQTGTWFDLLTSQVG